MDRTSDLKERLVAFAGSDDGMAPYVADGELVMEALALISQLEADKVRLEEALRAIAKVLHSGEGDAAGIVISALGGTDTP